MKIIITANAAWNISHFRRPIVEALIQEGHEVVALSPKDSSVAELEAMRVRHIPLRMDSNGINPIKDAGLLRDFRKIFLAEAPKVILSFTIKNNIYGALAVKSLAIPFLSNVSGLGTVFLKAGWLDWIATWLYRSAFRNLNYVIFQNADDREMFVDRKIISGAQGLLVPGSGIDLARFRPAESEAQSESATTFLLIARMLWDKGVIEYVEAARKVKEDFPQARFQLLGACGVENRTAIARSTVDQWVDQGTVEYLGEMPDVRPIINAADCVVLPSYREGAPRVLLEASAMAKPVIATDVPGCRDVVDHGVTGILCKVRSVDSLAEAIRNFLTMPKNKRSVMGQAGRQKMEKEFNQDIVVEIYRNAIRDVVS